MIPRTSHEVNENFGQEIFSFGFSSLTLIAMSVPSIPLRELHCDYSAKPRTRSEELFFLYALLHLGRDVGERDVTVLAVE